MQTVIICRDSTMQQDTESKDMNRCRLHFLLDDVHQHLSGAIHFGSHLSIELIYVNVGIDFLFILPK
jgi:hypothetical protein